MVTCSDGSSQAYSYLTVPETNTVTGISSTSTAVGKNTLTSFEVYAPMIEIRWQSSDRSAHTPTNTGSRSTSPPAQNSSSGSSGLSTGAKAAIGVVVPVAVIAILVGIFFFWRRKIKKLENNNNDWPAPGPSSAASFAQTSAHPQTETRSYYKSTDNRGRYMNPPGELDAAPAAQELEGSKTDRPGNG